MGAAQITGPDRDKTAPLQPSQGFKGFSQLFFRACHVFRASATLFTGFRAALIVGYSVVSSIGLSVDQKVGFPALLEALRPMVLHDLDRRAPL